ncbi:FAD-dependent oxidoreductase [Thermomonas alba]|uniref:FAD-dependent oxidoreductase n=1 Tax=Thermomonas alba TaxID=2888525 RepID=UPI001F036199|nr:FAD-dependent oxidoreductase [Thermomonas alba]
MPMQIGIAGAGLLGRLLAWKLASAGHAVHVYDPAPGPGPHSECAAFTAAGLLNPIAELDCGAAQIAALGWRSLALWREWLPELPSRIAFSDHGSLLLAHSADRASAQRTLARLTALASDQPPEPLSGPTLHTLQPGLAPDLLGWLLPGEGQIHTHQAMAALHAAGSQAGVHWHWNLRVKTVAPGFLDERRFDHVFDVRGVGAREALPVRGVRGEVLWLYAPGLCLPRPLRLLHPRHRVYVVPRPDDIVVVGASEIESEDRSPVSVRTVLELLSAAYSMIPALAEARLLHSETNLRPALPDNLPLVSQQPGLSRINGLFRHGWLIAPALVEQVLDFAS